MNADGSDLRPLTDGPEEHFYPVWAPDGSRIVSSNSRTFALTLFDPKVPWKSQRAEVLITPNAPDRFEALSWSPDGRMLAGRRRGPGGVGVAVYSMVDRKLQIVTATGDWPRWLNDNRTLVYVDQGGLNMVDIVTKASRALIPQSSELIRDFAISRDNRQLVLARGRNDADVWLATLK